jgi:uncharacterized protein (DUF1330 family)
MPAYLIARVKIHDMQIYKQYIERSPAIVAQYGGRFLARGGASEMLEGSASDRRVVIVEFPSMDAAKDFYKSPAYQQAKAIRTPVSDAEFLLVDGLT